MTVLLVPEAGAEFADALDYYKAAGVDVVRRFRDEVADAIAWITQHHEQFRVRRGGYRRINLRVFPWYLPFIVRGENLWVLAVAHAARAPEYWIERQPGV